MDYTIVTNNPQCYEKYRDRCTVEYDESWTYLDVLVRVRDHVHAGSQIITHPMAGSLKPNQTPYRSVVLAADTIEDKEPFNDLLLIENSIDAHNKFMRNRKLSDWPPEIRRDFQTVDLSLIDGAMTNPVIFRR